MDWFYEQLHKSMIVRRVAFFFMLWMTYKSYQWAFDFVATREVIDANTALIVAAILTPISTLQGAILKFYAQYKYKDEAKTGEE